jgi:hypothetical protein
VARPISVWPAAGWGYGRGVVEDALRRYLLELQPTPVDVGVPPHAEAQFHAPATPGGSPHRLCRLCYGNRGAAP